MRLFLAFACLTTLAGSSRADDAFAPVASILETRCLRCHGADDPKGKLSLATAEGLAAGSENGPVVVPGEPGESVLLDVVSGDAPTMPQADDPLTGEEVAAIRAWIAAGAAWPEGKTLDAREVGSPAWWSLTALEAPAVPAVPDARNEVDAFVLERLGRESISPSPEADRTTLIRRLTFDLHGIPPTPGEVTAFVADPAPDAYERLVDRLLASPRYGERQARRWLDVAHYADTHGYDKDKRRDNAWPYRDWVVGAFNRDLPYSEFVRLQLAADTVRPGDPEEQPALGFVVAGPWDFVGNVELREGTVDKEKTRLIDRDDMVANACSSFLSLTVHCARCHDHKFDPIPQRDYYQLQAVFAGVERDDVEWPDPDRERARESIENEIASHEVELSEVAREISYHRTPELDALSRRLRMAEASLASLPTLIAGDSSTTNGYHSSIEAADDRPKWVQIDLGGPRPIDWVLVFPARPTDFADTPGFGFPEEWTVSISDDPTFASATLIGEGRGTRPGDEPVAVAGMGKTARYVRVSAEMLWPRAGDFVFALSEVAVISQARNIAAGRAVSAADSIEAGRWGAAHLVDGQTSRARLQESDSPLWRDHAERLAERAGMRMELKALRETSLPAELVRRRELATGRLSEARNRLESLETPRRFYGPRLIEPRPIRILNRGEVEQPGQPVGPGALACLEPRGLGASFGEQSEPSRRARLAEWIVDERNPLTWRSMANRVWQSHFGRGLVDTPSDFGRNGSRPTHPELLDWLAASLRDDPGHSLKRLRRRILLSDTYRRSSAYRDGPAAVDAENRLLWRQNRRRLEAEEVRDAVLAAAGTLDHRMGGPGFALFRFKDDHSPIYDHDDPDWIDPEDGRRRSIYRFAVRSVTNPFLDCLDGADPNVGVAVRNETITPLQALALLNDPFMLNQAEAFAGRLERESSTSAGRIDRAFLLALGRPPTDEERVALAEYAGRHGLAQACRLVFNLNEFVLVD
jgi:mono/diheme cytochrome c family protein